MAVALKLVAEVGGQIIVPVPGAAMVAREVRDAA